MQQEIKELGDGTRIVVRFGIEEGRFKIESSLQQLKQGEWICQAFGLMRENIEQHFPHLSLLARWYQTSNNGTPLQYLANALYWYSGYRDYLDSEEYEAKAPRYFRRVIVSGSLPGDEEAILGFYNLGAHPNTVRDWLEARLPELQKAFLQDMVEFGVMEPPEDG
jgi:hypothetical protein